MAFDNKWIPKLKDEGSRLYYCFLDETRFYMQSRQERLHISLMVPFETVEEAFTYKTKARSSCFPCKHMCMVIVSSPVKGKTNGEIMMKRVSGQLVSKGDRYHQKFVLTYELNHK